MLIVTELARETLSSLLDDVSGPGLSLRLEVSTRGQLRLAVDEEREGDEVVEHEGTPLLLIGEELAGRLDGAVLDGEETAEGTRLTISR